jgi:hypothetical protein
MKYWEGIDRFERVQNLIAGRWIHGVARLPGDEGSWTRERAMPLGDILRCTLGKKGLTTVMELRRYFQETGDGEPAVSKQDYLRQRQKLNPKVFKLLNREYLRHFYAGKEVKWWQGMIVLAVDGSRVEIPNSKENRQVYGESENKYGKAVARANFSGLYDVYNGFFVDIGVHHFRSSELEEAKEHIGELKEIIGEQPVLIIFDRNYASLELMNYLEKRGIKYLIRLHAGDYKAEVVSMSSGDEEVELGHTKTRLEHLRRTRPERARELAQEESTHARIIKMRFDNGETGALITNLTDCGAGEIKRLYRKRWMIEKKYHTLKNKMRFESVTGKASIYVEQDLRAQVLVYNMVQDVITGAELQAQRKKKKKKPCRHKTRINENIATGLYKEQFIRLMLEEDPERKNLLFIHLKEEMMKNIVPVRVLPGSPRRWKYFNKYKCNLKPGF